MLGELPALGLYVPSPSAPHSELLIQSGFLLESMRRMKEVILNQVPASLLPPPRDALS
jgi:hypothetical protein